ncbi:MAG: sulfatase-like hydrolase/transferase [candidate division Zixibacteria bacterium]|nr:sulfatase-like hydrolase/transferase [candidate division Zixibacteria bacterium]
MIFLKAQFSDIAVHTYLGRSYVLYAIYLGAAAGLAALLGLLFKKLWPRPWPGVDAVAAGGALCAPVFALAVLANRAFPLTITHPAMLAADVLVLLIWLILSTYVGGKVYNRIGPARRGARRFVWAGLGYGGALLFVGVLLVLAFLPALTRPPPARGMNVLLITIDALRRDHLGCNGYERVETPCLDSFAASATTFENAYCSSPWTLPSMASMITGRHPAVCGVDELHRLRPGIPTLAEVLRSRGYRNEAYVTNIFMYPEYGYAEGFDLYLMNGDRPWLYPLRETLLYEWTSAGLLALDNKLGRARDDTRYNADETVAALRRLGKGGRPFFIWCHFMDPHNPYTPPRGYVPEYAGIAAAEAYEMLKELQAAGWRAGGWPITESRAPLFEMLYDGEIAYVDEQFGRIIDALREEGLDRNTMVIVLNDHGEEFYDHGSYGHGHTLYPELIDMVLLAQAPGQKFPAAARGRYITHVDIMPTVLDALGIEPPAALDGRSFLRGNPASGDDGQAFSEALQSGPERKAVRRDGWLLIVYDETDERELYDLAEDPGARKNLAARGLAIEEELSVEIARHVDATEEKVRALGRAATIAVSEERKARLRGLGYIMP